VIERYSRPAMKAVWSDEAKFHKWLQVEIAVCHGWAELGAVPKADLAKIERNARFDPASYATYLKQTHHDVTAFLRTVADSLGEESRFIHLGLTSSDIMDTSLALQLREAGDLLAEDVQTVILELEKKAREHQHTMMMGRTHGVHAEPITFGLKMALWAQEMRRHAERLSRAKEAISVGKVSGAVGTYATVPPEVERIACARLDLKPEPISNQIVQRDRHAEFVTTMALIGASLEKFATEFRALQRTEVREVEEPFEPGQTGSSAMPHKRNPELCERICGLARLLRGHAVTAMENVALWHERDISHSSAERLILPDSCLALDYILDLFATILKGLRVFPENMRRNVELTRGLVFSQRVMLALIDKSLARQKAYAIVQRNAMASWESGTPFLELLLADPEVTTHLPERELRPLFDYSFFLKHVDEVFERVGLSGSVLSTKAERP